MRCCFSSTFPRLCPWIIPQSREHLLSVPRYAATHLPVVPRALVGHQFLCIADEGRAAMKWQPIDDHRYCSLRAVCLSNAWAGAARSFNVVTAVSQRADVGDVPGVADLRAPAEVKLPHTGPGIELAKQRLGMRHQHQLGKRSEERRSFRPTRFAGRGEDPVPGCFNSIGHAVIVQAPTARHQRWLPGRSWSDRPAAWPARPLRTARRGPNSSATARPLTTGPPPAESVSSRLAWHTRHTHRSRGPHLRRTGGDAARGRSSLCPADGCDVNRRTNRVAPAQGRGVIGRRSLLRGRLCTGAGWAMSG
ncbi:hypothetical protein SUDANB96_06590 [Streptomyces sp. enrichment culture]